MKKEKPLSEKAIFIDGEYMQFDRDVKEAVEKLKKWTRDNSASSLYTFYPSAHELLEEIDKIFGNFGEEARR